MQIAVVTGGASGIGAALARRLAGGGWRCVLVGRREDRLQAAAAEIDGEYEVCDVGDRDAVERTAHMTESAPIQIILSHPNVKRR